MDYKNKVIEAEGKVYLIIETIKEKGKVYAYIVNEDDESAAKYVELKDNKMSEILPIYLNTVLFPKFVRKVTEKE